MNVLGICLDRRVLIALALGAVALWLVAPQLTLAALPVLVLLACPLSMLLMMRMMGQHSDSSDPKVGDPAARLAALEREQARLAAEIQRARHEVIASAEPLERAPVAGSANRSVSADRGVEA